MLGSLAGDARGSVTVELVIWLPLLIGLVVLVVEAGRVLVAHDVMVNGVRNATRYLSRVPLDDLAAELPNAQCLALTGRPDCSGTYGFWADPGTVTLDADPPDQLDPGIDDGGVFRTPVYQLVVRASTDFAIPLIGWLNDWPGFDADGAPVATVVGVGARDRSRHFGD
jgi:hypothetical protein